MAHVEAEITRGGVAHVKKEIIIGVMYHLKTEITRGGVAYFNKDNNMRSGLF